MPVSLPVEPMPPVPFREAARTVERALLQAIAVRTQLRHDLAVLRDRLLEAQERIDTLHTILAAFEAEQKMGGSHDDAQRD